MIEALFNVAAFFLGLAFEVLFAALPDRFRDFVFWRREVRPRLLRTRRGLCVHCGYDLRGNISGVCPECGKPAPQRPPSRTYTDHPKTLGPCDP